MKLFKPLLMISVSLCLLFFTGCDSGDGSGPDGNSTVQGNVTSFSVNGISYLPPGKDGFLSTIIDIIIPRAQAAVSGVGVYMTGTDYSTTTDEEGFFIMSGVTAGNHQMQFTYKGQESAVDIVIPENSTLTMQDVRCVGQQPATVGHMNIQMHSDVNSNNMNSSDNGIHGGNH